MRKTLPIRHSSLSKKIHEVLKDRIVNGELKPGERLLDDQLASIFGVSRTPVREALTRLATEGLVEIVPRSGVYVKKLTREDIEQIYEIRKVLEGLAARKATPLITERQIKQLTVLFNKARDSTGKINYKGHIELDIKLHDLILGSCQNERLARIMANLYTLIHVFRVRVGKNEEKAEQALRDHQRIFEAIKAGDEDKAEKAMMEHIERSKNNIFSLGVLE